MCYGEISGIDRDYHDYPESTIAQKVIFESSLWMLRILNHLKTISEPSQDHLNYLNISQLDLWCGLRLPVGLRSVYRCHVIYSTSKLISKIVFFFSKSGNGIFFPTSLESPRITLDFSQWIFKALVTYAKESF